jgi:hypothetical protein
MRDAYAHEAHLELAGNGDDRAPGAAVTVALCGHWDHDPPCRVPHHSEVVAREGDRLTLRVVFASAVDDADAVRTAVARALDDGRLSVPGPDDAPATTWTVIEQAPSALTDGELPLAGRLAAHPER